jgi:hypothetical protein
MRVDATDLASFATFQQRVERELGVRVLPDHQSEPASRRRAWSAEVERARARRS